MSKSEEKRLKIMKEATLTNDALGLFQDETTKEWFVAHLRFNPKSGDASVVAKIPTGEKAKNFAIERFKITALKLDMVD